MRIVDMPFTYTVHGVLKHCRVAEDHIVQDSLPVSIREVSTEEAPPAITSIQDGRTYTHIRMIDGKALRPFRSATLSRDENAVGTLLGIDQLEKEIARVLQSGSLVRWKSYPGPIDVSQHGPGWSHGPNLHGEVTFREVLSSGRETALAAVNRMAERLVSVDGKLWVGEHAEHAWFVQLKEREVRIVLASAAADLKGWHRFAGDRKDDAVRLAEHLSRASRRPISAPDFRIDPDLDDWTINDAGGSLKDAATIVYGLGATEAFRDLPVEFFAPYAVLRDAAKRDLVQIDMPKVDAALGEFVELARLHVDPDDIACPYAGMVRQLDVYLWRARQLDGHIIYGMDRDLSTSPDLGL